MATEPLPSRLNTALAQLWDETRLYALEGDAAAFSALFVERWSGWEALNAGFRYTVDCLSTDARLPLDDMLGQRLTLKTRLADGTVHPRSGIVSEAECTGSDGGLARYRLRLVPWIHLLAQGRHSQLYQNQTVLQILEVVFSRYKSLAAWRVADEVGPFLADTRVRSECAQYRESDWDFVTRLLAEEGLGFYVEANPEVPAGHELVIFADSRLTPEDPSSQSARGIRFHRDDATESTDAVQGFGAKHSLSPTELTWLTYDYKSTQALGVNTPLQNAIEAARLELYDPAGPYAFANESEAQRYLKLAAQALEARQVSWFGLSSVRTFHAGHWFHLTEAPSEDDNATPPEVLLTAVRHAGINNLPQALIETLDDEAEAELDPGLDALDAEILLPPDLTSFLDQTDDALLAQRRASRAGAVGYTGHFLALPRSQPWRPILRDGTGIRWNPRPTVNGPQTAIVVGPNGEATPSGPSEIYCDKLGRVRLQFRWQGDVPATAWVRVAQRQASPDGVGVQWLPRIGTEVLVEFLDNDVDRPLIVGSLYDGQGEGGIPPTPGGKSASADLDVYAKATDHTSSAQGNLAGGRAPPWHGAASGDDAHRNAAALSGVKSKEFGGNGYNQLAFDDTDDQLRIQFSTTQAATQFNAGHLIHQAGNYRGSFRGQGWELRTDAYGAIRAIAGVWLSTYAIQPTDPAGQSAPATALLKQATTLLETFDEAASTHQSVSFASHRGVGSTEKSRLINDTPPAKALLTSMQTLVPAADYSDAQGEAQERNNTVADDRLPHSGDAIVGIAAKAGIGLVAGQSVQWLAGETLTLASGQQSNWAIAGNLRLHTGQAIGLLAGASGGEGLRIIAGQGPLDAQAQHGPLKLQARDQLKVISTSAAVELAAGKRLVLKTAGGASLTIEGGNMTWTCPGEIRIHASNQIFDGPAQLSREMNSWPKTKFDQQFVVTDEVTDEPLKNVGVELIRADGAKLRLTTDSQGRLPIQKSEWMEKVKLRVLPRGKGSVS